LLGPRLQAELDNALKQREQLVLAEKLFNMEITAYPSLALVGGSYDHGRVRVGWCLHKLGETSPASAPSPCAVVLREGKNVIDMMIKRHILSPATLIFLAG
jgi:hypothetical protein